MAAKIGILGGTFDPIHNGHLAIAEEARVALDLERVVFIPARYQPLKAGKHAATAEQRLAMTLLACASNPAFEVSPIEVERSGPSYTATTLEAFAAQTTAELALIVGVDALADFDRWHTPERIIQLAKIIGVSRAGSSVDLAHVHLALPQLRARLTLIDGPQVEISSSAIRERVATGRPIRYLIPDPVMFFITEHRLYR